MSEAATATPVEETKAEEPKAEEPKVEVAKAVAPDNSDEIVQQVEVSTPTTLLHATLFCSSSQVVFFPSSPPGLTNCLWLHPACASPPPARPYHGVTHRCGSTMPCPPNATRCRPMGNRHYSWAAEVEHMVQFGFAFVSTVVHYGQVPSPVGPLPPRHCWGSAARRGTTAK